MPCEQLDLGDVEASILQVVPYCLDGACDRLMHEAAVTVACWTRDGEGVEALPEVASLWAARVDAKGADVLVGRLFR